MRTIPTLLQRFAMSGFLALGLLAAAPLMIADWGGRVFAQQGAQQGNQDGPKEIQLTEKHIQSYLAAQKDMAVVDAKLEKADPDKPDPKLAAELESVAKKHGFANYGEYDSASTSISMIMSGLDPATKAFSEPPVAIKKEIDAVKDDKKMPKAEKDETLKELNEALKTAKPVQFRENIELVKKYFDKLDGASQ